MTGPSRLPVRGTPRQPWTPEHPAQGITCPACGLRNDPGARICRNCGLPIASAGDPLRGVTRGRVDMPGARGSGVSATVGLVTVVAVLLLAGTLAVSGGGLLNRGALHCWPIHEAAAGQGAVGRDVFHHLRWPIHCRGDADPGTHLTSAGTQVDRVEGEQMLQGLEVIALEPFENPVIERRVNPTSVELTGEVGESARGIDRYPFWPIR